MKRATVKDLRNRFPRIAAWIEQGQAVARRVISPGLALIACVVLAGVAGGAPREGPFVLGGRAEGLALNADGALLGWEGRSGEMRLPGLPAPERSVVQAPFSNWPGRPR